MLRMSAPAKVNLVLEVLGRRSDGYHDIRSIMQTIGLCDKLTFEHSNDLALKCNLPELCTENNLILRAAGALRAATGCRDGAMLMLEKKIPLAAGLGGGSSDAAATILGLNRLWKLSLTHADLMRIAASLGSDVPFFISGGTCLVEGRGEKVSSLPDIKKSWFVLLKPDLQVTEGKTARLYEMLRVNHYTTGVYTERARDELEREGCLRPTLLHNVFDEVADDAFKGLRDFREAMICAGAVNVCLAGSGPVLFSMFDDQAKARGVFRHLKRKNMQVYLVTSVPGVKH